MKDLLLQLFEIASNRNATVSDLWVVMEKEGSQSLLLRRHFQDWKLGVVMQFMKHFHKVKSTKRMGG